MLPYGSSYSPTPIPENTHTNQSTQYHPPSSTTYVPTLTTQVNFARRVNLTPPPTNVVATPFPGQATTRNKRLGEPQENERQKKARWDAVADRVQDSQQLQTNLLQKFREQNEYHARGDEKFNPLQQQARWGERNGPHASYSLESESYDLFDLQLLDDTLGLNSLQSEQQPDSDLEEQDWQQADLSFESESFDFFDLPANETQKLAQSFDDTTQCTAMQSAKHPLINNGQAEQEWQKVVLSVKPEPQESFALSANELDRGITQPLSATPLIKKHLKSSRQPSKAKATTPLFKELFRSELVKKNVDVSLFKLPYPSQVYELRAGIEFPEDAEWSFFYSEIITSSGWWHDKMKKNKVIFCLNEYNFPIWVILLDDDDRLNSASLRRNFEKVVLSYYWEINENSPYYGGKNLKVGNEAYFILAPRGVLASGQSNIKSASLQQTILPQENIDLVASIQPSLQLPSQLKSDILERERNLLQECADVCQKIHAMELSQLQAQISTFERECGITLPTTETPLRMMGQLRGELMILNWALESNSAKEQLFEEINDILFEHLQQTILIKDSPLDISEIKRALFSEIGGRGDEDLTTEQAVNLLLQFNLGFGTGITQGMSLLTQWK